MQIATGDGVFTLTSNKCCFYSAPVLYARLPWIVWYITSLHKALCGKQKKGVSVLQCITSSHPQCVDWFLLLLFVFVKCMNVFHGCYFFLSTFQI